MLTEPEELAQIEEQLALAAMNSGRLEFASSVGSAPGAGRQYQIVAFDRATRTMQVRKIDEAGRASTEVSTYRSKYVIWLKRPDGSVITNKLTESVFTGIQERRQQRREEASQLYEVFSAPTPAPPHAADSGGETATRHNVTLNQARTGNRTIVVVRDASMEKPVRDALAYLVEHGWLQTRRVLGLLLHAGLEWPFWSTHLKALAREGEVLRDGLAPHREVRPLPGEKPWEARDRGDLYHRIYARSTIRPPEYETDGSAIDRLTLFEIGSMDFTPMLRAASRASAHAINGYVFHARFFGANSHSAEMAQLQERYQVPSGSLKELASAELAVPASQARLENVIDVVPIKELREAAKSIDRKAPTRSRAGVLEFCRRESSGRLEAMLRASPALGEQWVLLPPSPWSWSDFSDFYTVYVEMVLELVRWMNSEPHCVQV